MEKGGGAVTPCLTPTITQPARRGRREEGGKKKGGGRTYKSTTYGHLFSLLPIHIYRPETIGTAEEKKEGKKGGGVGVVCPGSSLVHKRERNRKGKGKGKGGENSGIFRRG